MCRLAIACLVVVVAAGCAPHARPAASTTAAAVQSAPDHPDWARLKPLRNYLRLVEVGPFAHHFTVWYHDEEPCVCDAVVDGSASDPHVALRNCWFGGMAMRPQSVTPVPPALAGIAEAVWARVQEKEAGARDPLVRYDGEYRELRFAEAIPLVTGHAGGLAAMLALASDAELTRVRRVIGSTTGIGALCGGIEDVRCSETPRWIRFDAPPRGHSLLERYRVELATDTVDGDPLATTLLDEARRAVAHAPPLPLEALPVGDTLLPAGLEQHVQAVVEVWGMRFGRGGAAVAGKLMLPFDARDIARGDAHAEGHFDVGGRGFDVSMVVRGDPASKSGEARREVTIRVRDSRGNEFGWIYPATAYLLVDGDRAAASSVLIAYPRSGSGPSRPEQDLPGGGDIEKFLLHVDPELRPVWRDEP